MLMLLLVVPALAGGTSSPTAYAGRSGFRWYDVIGVTPDGTRVNEFDIGFERGRCSDGEPYHSEFAAGIKHGANIDAAGTVSYALTSRANRATFITRRGKMIHGTERIIFTIHFAGGRLQGTAHDVFHSAKLTCSSGKVTFAGYPEGSPQAPLQDANATTAVYRGNTSQAKDRVTVGVYLPLNWVESIRIGWTASCHHGYSVRSSSTAYALPIKGSLISRHSRGVTQTSPSGLYDTFRGQLSGRFLVSAGRYILRGTLSWSFVAYTKGHRDYACSTGPVTFTASGPRVSPSARSGVSPSGPRVA